MKRLTVLVCIFTLLVCVINAAAEEWKVRDDGIQLKITVGGEELIADLSENSSVDALIALLKEDPLTIDMHDYSNFEKVGDLPEEIVRNDEDISTGPGDLILYLGKRFVIYYDHNNWDFTRIGKIPDVETEELLKLLGDGDVTIELSLIEPETKVD